MQKLASTLVAILILTTLALAQTTEPTVNENDCTLGEVRPVLNDSADFKVERSGNGTRKLIERTTLNSSTTVEIQQGGCAHYGVQIKFSITSRHEDSGTSAVEDALPLLNELKTRTDPDWSVVTVMSEMLEARKNEPLNPGDIIQDSSHPDITVDLTSRERDGICEIQVGYSFAL